MLKTFCLILLYHLVINCYTHTQDYCDIETKDCGAKTRYLFYDVNPPEGFNLRRDVYMRYAIFVEGLQRLGDENLNKFKLVLPPWSMLYHWRRSDEPEQIPWGKFFDLDSMKKFAPVMEMYEFFTEYEKGKFGHVNIDYVYVLQHYQDMFVSGKFEEKFSQEKCNEPIKTTFFYYTNMTSKNKQCLSFHGFTSHLSNILSRTDAQTLLFDRAEVALQDKFGGTKYWQCRRSMRFNKDLHTIAREFRKKFLNSSDEYDNTVLPDDWMLEKPRRNAKGGPYLSVHIRRRDFIYGRPKHVPSLKNAAKQIKDKLKELELTNIYVASDAPEKEYEELKSYIGPNINVFKFKPNKEIKKEYKDGGIAIIDQIICSYAKYFIGTYESTFSFRIQEEREILGFPAKRTFNRFCGDEESECGPTTMWKIQY